MKRISVLGFGSMGEALARGLSERHPDIEIAVLEKRAERRSLCDTLGYRSFPQTELAAFLGYCDTVVLSIKPQDLAALTGSATNDTEATTIARFAEVDVLSILAGTPMATLQAVLRPRGVARLMPSLAAQVGRAAVGVALPESASDALRAKALLVAEAMGTAYELPERLMSAITGLSGSGLAYVFAFIHALALGGTRAGIPYSQSLAIAREVTAGAAELLSQTGDHPIEALSRVISPAGTTIEGVSVLEERGFSAAVIDAVIAAADRAAELEG
ncbi:MAG: pyrroline-5-carboxylate reductase [Spirochaetaceae bacterium]|nr:MAG: pyrroline-5-carboxylate reductase [Spirochaetaceae bacterium]